MPTGAEEFAPPTPGNAMQLADADCEAGGLKKQSKRKQNRE
jgi:hypothetical protein